MGNLTPDFEEAYRFVDLLGAGEAFTFMTIADQKEDVHRALAAGYRPLSLTRVYHGTLYEHMEELARMNARGAGVFVMVNEGDGLVHAGKRTCRTGANVTRVRALFVDLDGAPLEPVLNHGIPPSIIVETSPGRWHAYWLTDGCALKDFTPAQRGLIREFKSDKAVCDLPRVMRLPGFYHQKAEPFMTKIIYPEVTECN